MRTKVLLTIAAALMLIISLVAIGSNMAFKISIPLTAGYSNFVSLPYYNSYTNASLMFNDITSASAVSRYDNPTTSWQDWSGTRGTNFTVNEGEAYVVQVSASSNWIVVGSHDPGKAITLTTGYSNMIAPPYHTTKTNASLLFNEIPNASDLSRYDNPTTSWQDWSGTRGTNFAITAGEGLVAQVSVTSSTWTPAHY